jgi:SdrD B-like domain/Domain of unknown function DUF11
MFVWGIIMVDTFIFTYIMKRGYLVIFVSVCLMVLSSSVSTVSACSKSNFRCVDGHQWIYDNCDGSIGNAMRSCDEPNEVCAGWYPGSDTTDPWGDARCSPIMSSSDYVFNYATPAGHGWSACVQDIASGNPSAYRALTCSCNLAAWYDGPWCTKWCIDSAGNMITIPDGMYEDGDNKCVTSPPGKCELEVNGEILSTNYGAGETTGAKTLNLWETGYIVCNSNNNGDTNISIDWININSFVHTFDSMARGVGDHKLVCRNTNNGWRRCHATISVVDVQPDLAITALSSVTWVVNVADESVNWTINYVNNGSKQADVVTIVSTLPAGFVYDDSLAATAVFSWITLSGNQVIWKRANPLGVGSMGTITFKTKYTWGQSDGTNLTNTVTIATATAESSLANNTATAIVQPYTKPPLSCDSLTLSRAYTATGASIGYVCDHNGVSPAVFRLYSGGVQIGADRIGNAGSVFASPGKYIGKCFSDGGVWYGVVSYQPPTTISCAYRKVTATSEICAEKSTLDPYKPGLDLSNLVLMPSPVAYCESIAPRPDNTNSTCVDAPAWSNILIQDPLSCTRAVEVERQGKIGDRVWLDTDKDGVQDAGENGLWGINVGIYRDNGWWVLSYLTGVTTNVAGEYLFTNLEGWNYQIQFTKPVWFARSPKWWTGASMDNNAPDVTNVYLDPDSGIIQDLTIDAGIYLDVPDCTTDSSIICPRNTCGDGAITSQPVMLSNGSFGTEKCDDGVRNGWALSSCDLYCQIKVVPPIRTFTTRIISSVDPGYTQEANVMMGEFVPFWRKFNYTNVWVRFVNNCDSITSDDPSNMYVLGKDSDDKPQCVFYVQNGAEEKSPAFVVPCDIKENYHSGQNLFRTYIDSASTGMQTSYSWAVWASYFSPVDWNTYGSGFTKLWEYQFVWAATAYRTCDRIVDSTGDFLRYDLSPEITLEDNADSVSSFTVTSPYMLQEWSALSVTKWDADIIRRIVWFAWDAGTSLLGTLTQVAWYGWSSNLDYLVQWFVSKYAGLATTPVDAPAWFNTSAISKIGNNDIYVVRGDLTIDGSSTTASPRNIWHKTIIVMWNLTIKWNIASTSMFIANGTISFIPLSTDERQVVGGIFIGKTGWNPLIRNDDIMKTRYSDGRLFVNGIMIYRNAGATESPFTLLKNSRRSALKWWFESTNKLQTIKDGAGLIIRNSPNMWLDLPPGANELMTVLQAFK